MNKAVFSLIIILILPFYQVYAKESSFVNEDTGYKLLIEDDAELISDPEEFDALISDMQPLTAYGNIGFKSILNNEYGSSKSYANNFYNLKFGVKSNGTLFLFDMDQRMIYIFSNGSNYRVITSDKADIITDNAYKYASNKEYYKCTSEAFKQMNALLKGDKINEPMRYTSNAVLAVVIGFLVNFVFVLINSNLKSATTSEVIKNCNIKFLVNNVVGVKVGEHRVYTPRSSSTSGGGHSSGGHSSHSSGGGGGHRF